MVLLDFEAAIGELYEQLEKAKKMQTETQVDMGSVIVELEKKISDRKAEIYSNLSPWQRVQLSRHPERPYTLSYIEALTGGDFIELHGDRMVKDDKAMIGGFGNFEGQTVMFIGQQKGTTTKLRQYRNFGMANPDGYRKALRMMRLAEKFGKPIITLIDTPGAFPGLEAEERGQGEAIARNIYEMFRIKVPIICIVIGEGASGGAIGIGVGDRVLMLENTWYSVISPESCSSILWRSWDQKQVAAAALKLTSEDMLAQGLIDGVVKEPLGGAHSNPEAMFEILRETIRTNLSDLRKKTPDQLVVERIDKFSKFGTYIED
ncbi:MAG: hypothetical protein RIS47_1880 [Bacteroidota bacterium]|jgi:acetyl-CoA carboxylase carboxyl transferase subunit alpha